MSLGLPHYPSAQLSSAGQSLPLLRGGLRGVAASDGTGDQSLAMMEDVAATDIVHNAGGRCTVTDPAVHGER